LGWTRILLILPIFSVSSFFLDKLLNIQRERDPVIQEKSGKEIQKKEEQRRGM
jgi:hypothetical protein